MASLGDQSPYACVAGMKVVMQDTEHAAAAICQDARSAVGRVYVLLNAHSSLLRRTSSPYARLIMDSSNCHTLPDGASLSLAARLLGQRSERCPGPDLLEACCALCAERSIPVFLLGGADGVADALADALLSRHKGLDVAGTATPSFGEWTEEEDRRLVRAVRESGAEVLWLGVSAPKQEVWAYTHLRELGLPVVCVGAAFDFNTGAKARAPKWMRKWGLEWVHRLASEPRRTWRRYLVGNSLFLLDVVRHGGRLARPASGDNSLQ